MNSSRLAPVAVALLCITALGVSATTLETTLTTDPDEEIDPEYELLPIGQEDALTIQQEMDGTDEGDPGNGQDGDPTDESEDDPSDPDESDEESAASDSGDDGTGSSDDGTGTAPSAPDLLDRLLALLLALLRVLMPAAVVLASLALAVRYRERIAAALAALVASGAPDDRSPVRDEIEAWPPAAPENPVDRAWVTMVRQAGLDRPAVMTPSECAAAAREAGLDPRAVADITDAFERVHYGGRPASAEAERAEDGLRRLQNADGGSRSGDRPGTDDRSSIDDRSSTDHRSTTDDRLRTDGRTRTGERVGEER